MAREDIDRVAVQRDAALVHALSTRTVPAADVDLDDPVVVYLARWVDWIDDGVTEDTAFELEMHKDRVVSLSGSRRKRAALIAGSTVAALLVSSGAAAAVTGDPLLIAKAPFTVLKHVNPFDGGDAPGASEKLPSNAADVAKGNKLLADAQRAAAQGDSQRAKALLVEAQSLLGEELTKGQQNRVDKLNEDLGIDPADANGAPSDPGSGGANGGQDGTGGSAGGNTGGPKDNSPVDNQNKGNGKDNSPVDHSPNGSGAGTNSGQGGKDPDAPDDPPDTKQNNRNPDPGGDQGKGSGLGGTKPNDSKGSKDAGDAKPDASGKGGGAATKDTSGA